MKLTMALTMINNNVQHDNNVSHNNTKTCQIKQGENVCVVSFFFTYKEQ